MNRECFFPHLVDGANGRSQRDLIEKCDESGAEVTLGREFTAHACKFTCER